MDYKAITNTNSAQYKLIHSNQIQIGSDGLLYDKYGFVGVAIGSAHGNIGDRFIVHLDNGKTFKAIKLDARADIHTTNGCNHINGGSVIEFVIDTNLASQSYPNSITMGNFNYEDKFNGAVTSITQVSLQN